MRTCEDPTREEMLEFLYTLSSPALQECTDFDIEEAIYWFANDWHGGQDTNLYEALSQSPFKPGVTQSYIISNSYAGMLYEELENKYASPIVPDAA